MRLYSYTPINLVTSLNGYLTGIPSLNVLAFSGINDVLSAHSYASGCFCQTGIRYRVIQFLEESLMRIDLYTKFIMTLAAIGLLLIGMKGFIAPTVAAVDNPWQISASCNQMSCRLWALNQSTGAIK